MKPSYKVKTIFSIITMVCIVVAIFYAKKQVNPKTLQVAMDQINSVTIKDESYITGDGEPKRVLIYQHQDPVCKLSHEISSRKIKGFYLRVRYQGCQLPFDLQKKIHLSLLKRASADWNFKELYSVGTSGLGTIEPNQNWIKKVMELAIKDKDVLDYKKNYPNHSSKLSSNSILVNLINEHRILDPFIAVFKTVSVDLKLESCEKVFQMRANEAKELGVDISPHKMMIYDAGTLYFKAQN